VVDDDPGSERTDQKMVLIVLAHFTGMGDPIDVDFVVPWLPRRGVRCDDRLGHGILDLTAEKGEGRREKLFASSSGL
jgi:hypothetical protein